MKSFAHTCAHWTLNVVKRLANERNCTLAEACPPEVLLAVVGMVMRGEVAEVVAKRELGNVVEWCRRAKAEL